MSTLQSAMASASRLSEHIDIHLGDRAENVSLNGRLAIALHSIALDHREAAILLLSAGARTNTGGVARSSLEAYVSASWIEHLASEDDARKFMRAERTLPSYETMSQRLRKGHPLTEVFEKLRAHYKTLSDYSHGSVRQVSRWVGQDGIEPRHSDDEMAEVLRFVDTIGVLACISRESITGRPIEPFTKAFDDVQHGRF